MKYPAHRLTLALLSIIIFSAGLTNTVSADHKQSTIILATNYPPFDIAEPVDGLHGFDHEVAVEAFQRKGIDATIAYVPWSRAVKDTENGHYPALLTCASTTERAEHYRFSDPISGERYGIYAREGFPIFQLNEIPHLSGYSVASVLEYAPNQELEAVGADLVDVPSDTIGFKMLGLGRVDFLYTGEAAGNYLIKSLGMENTLQFAPFVIWNYHLCFSRKHPEGESLRKLFNEGLAEIKADGTYDAIHAKYR